MNDFYEVLMNKGLINVINPVDYVKPTFIGEEKVYSALNDIVVNNKKVLIYGDYDADGVHSLLSVRDTFDHIGFKNYALYNYKHHTHLIDPLAVMKAIEEKFEYMIILDTGSSELGVLGKLELFGVSTIVIDHHQTIHKYEEFPKHCSIINSAMENKILKEDVYKLSAGALTYIIMSEFILRMGYPELEHLPAYATVSLYADCVDMSSDLCRGIYYKSVAISDYKLPKYITHFMVNNMKFNRRFIEFHYTPKVNSLFRTENFDLINKYFLSNTLNSIDTSSYIESIIGVYEGARELVDKATDIIDYKVLDNFVIANLSSVDRYIPVMENKLYNYTGLVANKLGSRYSKTAVVYCGTGTYIKGSVRDLFSRDYLTLFKQFCNANGHKPAFGLRINYVEFTEFLEYIERIDKKFFIKSVPNSPIVIEHNYSEPDVKLMTDIAIYNEFSGNEIPVAFIEKKLVGNMNGYSGKFYTNYNWGSMKIQSPVKIDFGSKITIKPIRSNTTKLLAYDTNLRW